MENKKNAFLHIRISPELHDQISKAAKRDVRSISSYVITAIKEKMENEKLRSR